MTDNSTLYMPRLGTYFLPFFVGYSVLYTQCCSSPIPSSRVERKEGEVNGGEGTQCTTPDGISPPGLARRPLPPSKRRKQRIRQIWFFPPSTKGYLKRIEHQKNTSRFLCAFISFLALVFSTVRVQSMSVASKQAMVSGCALPPPPPPLTHSPYLNGPSSSPPLLVFPDLCV